jgi:hypothetical protein
MHKKISRTIWQIVRPPIGEGARKLLAFLFMILGIPRVVNWPGPAHVEYLDSCIYGILLCMGGIALLATTRARYNVPGKVVAVFGVFVTVALGVDTLPSIAAALLYFALCLALVGQAGMVRDASDC